MRYKSFTIVGWPGTLKYANAGASKRTLDPDSMTLREGDLSDVVVWAHRLDEPIENQTGSRVAIPETHPMFNFDIFWSRNMQGMAFDALRPDTSAPDAKYGNVNAAKIVKREFPWVVQHYLTKG